MRDLSVPISADDGADAGVYAPLDIFRDKPMRMLSLDETASMEDVKEKAFALLFAMENAENGPGRLRPDPRCMSIARTKLEEAVMWAVKGITA